MENNLYRTKQKPRVICKGACMEFFPIKFLRACALRMRNIKVNTEPLLDYYPAKFFSLFRFLPQSVKSYPVHVLRFEPCWFCNVINCSQPFSYLPGLSHETVKPTFLLAELVDIITIAAEEIFPSPI